MKRLQQPIFARPTRDANAESADPEIVVPAAEGEALVGHGNPRLYTIRPIWAPKPRDRAVMVGQFRSSASKIATRGLKIGVERTTAARYIVNARIEPNAPNERALEFPFKVDTRLYSHSTKLYSHLIRRNL